MYFFPGRILYEREDVSFDRSILYSAECSVPDEDCGNAGKGTLEQSAKLVPVG
jgi:hypothetical protein